MVAASGAVSSGPSRWLNGRQSTPTDQVEKAQAAEDNIESSDIDDDIDIDNSNDDPFELDDNDDDAVNDGDNGGGDDNYIDDLVKY